MSYFKCQKCDNEWIVSGEVEKMECPKCKTIINYSKELENDWFNEKDSYGNLVRRRFKGSSEDDCRRKAAEYYKCDYRDVLYFIVKRKGLFSSMVICATQPPKYEEDPDATRIVCWRYENKDAIWLEINKKKKTILYPNELGNKIHSYNSFNSLVFKPEKLNNIQKFRLILNPNVDVIIPFYPDCQNNIKDLFELFKEELAPVDHGLYLWQSTIYANPWNKGETIANGKMYGKDIDIKGMLTMWIDDHYLCIYDHSNYQKYYFKYDQIKYYRLLGSKYVTTEISGGGGGDLSIKGAIIGGLIAGDVGAVIGSRKVVDEITSNSVVHDEQSVLLYDYSLKEIYAFSSNVYSIFTKLMPEKEYEIVVNVDKVYKDTTTSTEIYALEKLANLVDKGIITREEFEEKKKDILSRI